MEVSIISRETLKPSSLPLDHHLKSHKLCLFDQITPFTYASIMVFYRIADPDFDVPQTLAQLKKSLSETLTLFYPFSGRTKDNLYVDEFDAGVVYVEANVSCTLAEYFKLRQNELLDQFVPFPPFRNETDDSKPQIGFQVNVFACGGIAISTSLGHKVADGGTLSHFLMSWATAFQGAPHKIIKPNLSDAPIVFPPRENFPQKYKTLMYKLWFKKGNFITRRFVFNADAVATLREMAKSEEVPKPTRNEAVTCFVWKHMAAASKEVSGSARASIVAHATNMRPRVKSRVLNTAIGNLFWWARAASDRAADADLQELVVTLRESLANFSNKYLESLESEVGFAAVSEFFDQIEEILSSEPENAPDIYGFSNWGGFFNEVNFGWGKPIWVGAHGKVGSEFRNLVFFVDKQGGKGIEAFMTLEEKHMAALEKDMKFMSFASPNPEELPCM